MLYVDMQGDGCYAIRAGSGERKIGAVDLCPVWRKEEADFLEFFVTTIGAFSLEDDELWPTEKNNEIRLLLIKPRPDLIEHDMLVHERIQFCRTRVCLNDWIPFDPKSRLLVLV
jgi:hypothetical protein